MKIPDYKYNITIVFNTKFHNGVRETNTVTFEECTLERKDDCYIINHLERHNWYEVLIPLNNVLYIKRTTPSQDNMKGD